VSDVRLAINDALLETDLDWDCYMPVLAEALTIALYSFAVGTVQQSRPLCGGCQRQEVARV
jgi:hypothetical protein